jgi:hypothetical protein
MPVRSAVQAVNIRPIMNRAVGARPGIEIDPSDWNGPGEVDPLLAALSHRIDDGVPIPVVVRCSVISRDVFQLQGSNAGRSVMG